MQFAFDGSAPLYQQLAAQIEEMIFTGGFDEEKIGRASCRERV